MSEEELNDPIKENEWCQFFIRAKNYFYCPDYEGKNSIVKTFILLCSFYLTLEIFDIVKKVFFNKLLPEAEWFRPIYYTAHLGLISVIIGISIYIPMVIFNLIGGRKSSLKLILNSVCVGISQIYIIILLFISLAFSAFLSEWSIAFNVIEILVVLLLVASFFINIVYYGFYKNVSFNFIKVRLVPRLALTVVATVAGVFIFVILQFIPKLVSKDLIFDFEKAKASIAEANNGKKGEEFKPNTQRSNEP